MQLIALLILIYAVKCAIGDARSAWRKSKDAYMRSADARFPDMPRSRRPLHAARHDTGYWAGQAAHGFPAARHGAAAGWHAGRQAQAEGRAARERARAEQLEARVRLRPAIREFRARQQAAREELRTAKRAVPGNDTEGRCLYCGAPDGAECDPGCPYLTMDWREAERARRERAGREGTAPEPAVPEPDGRSWSYTSAGNPLAWPAAGPDQARGQARYWSTEGRPWVVHEYPPGGGPGTVIAAYLNGEEIQPAPGQLAAWDAEAAGRRRRYEQQGKLATAQGGQSMTAAADTTYDGVLAGMAAAKNVAEGHAAELAQASGRAGAMADEMQALEVDPATLSAMADHLDAHAEAVTAQNRVIETADTVAAALKRGHAALAEAHRNAPVQAAAREFYQD